jgi:two-component system, cell cycle sensor histidine kinase and response regulator CckA
MESLGRLAGKVAHDFNNMLGVIVNYANFVAEEAASPSPDLSGISSDAQQIIQATERGTRLTQQLLAFASRSAVRPSSVDLNQLIGSCLPDGVEFRPGGDLPPVAGDPAALVQLIGNIVESLGGGVVMDTDRHGAQVRLRATDLSKELTCSEVERAFEPFFSIGGSGFGLAMAYGIVMQAGGEICIESSIGAGTTVTVLLPASPASS